MFDIGRREFLGFIGGGMEWPVVAAAQQQKGPLIGFLSSRSPDDSEPHLAGFPRGLEAFGYVDGKSATSRHLIRHVCAAAHARSSPKRCRRAVI